MLLYRPICAVRYPKQCHSKDICRTEAPFYCIRMYCTQNYGVQFRTTWCCYHKFHSTINRNSDRQCRFRPERVLRMPPPSPRPLQQQQHSKNSSKTNSPGKIQGNLPMNRDDWGGTTACHPNPQPLVEMEETEITARNFWRWQRRWEWQRLLQEAFGDGRVRNGSNKPTEMRDEEMAAKSLWRQDG